MAHLKQSMLTSCVWGIREGSTGNLECFLQKTAFEPGLEKRVGRDFKWRLTHAVDGDEVSFNHEVNPSFTMNLLTLGPIPAFAVRNTSLHCMHCTSSPLQHVQTSVKHRLCRTPCTETPTNMLTALRASQTNHTHETGVMHEVALCDMGQASGHLE